MSSGPEDATPKTERKGGKEEFGAAEVKGDQNTTGKADKEREIRTSQVQTPTQKPKDFIANHRSLLIIQKP